MLPAVEHSTGSRWIATKLPTPHACLRRSLWQPSAADEPAPAAAGGCGTARARLDQVDEAPVRHRQKQCPMLVVAGARRGRAWSRSMWSTPRRSRLPSTAFWMCAGVTRVSPSFLRYLLPYPATCTVALWQRSTAHLASDGARRSS